MIDGIFILNYYRGNEMDFVVVGCGVAVRREERDDDICVVARRCLLFCCVLFVSIE